jgi:hypothetical protein
VKLIYITDNAWGLTRQTEHRAASLVEWYRNTAPCNETEGSLTHSQNQVDIPTQIPQHHTTATPKCHIWISSHCPTSDKKRHHFTFG